MSLERRHHYKRRGPQTLKVTCEHLMEDGASTQETWVKPISEVYPATTASQALTLEEYTAIFPTQNCENGRGSPQNPRNAKRQRIPDSDIGVRDDKEKVGGCKRIK